MEKDYSAAISNGSEFAHSTLKRCGRKALYVLTQQATLKFYLLSPLISPYVNSQAIAKLFTYSKTLSVQLSVYLKMVSEFLVIFHRLGNKIQNILPDFEVSF